VLSATNKLLQHIFRELEISPNRSFRASELKHISSADFKQLLKEKLLKPYRYEPEGDNYPCTDGCSSCKAGYMRRVNGAGNKWEAGCPDGEADTKSIPLSDDDITKYSFDINRFIEEIHNSRGLTGNVSKMDKRLYFIGVGDIKGKQTGLMLAFLNNRHTAKSLFLSIPQLLPRYQAYIILLPFFSDITPATVKTLEDNHVYLVQFARVFTNEGVFVKPDLVSNITSRFPLKQPEVTPVVITFKSRGRKIEVDITGTNQTVILRLRHSPKLVSDIICARAYGVQTVEALLKASNKFMRNVFPSKRKKGRTKWNLKNQEKNLGREIKKINELFDSPIISKRQNNYLWTQSGDTYITCFAETKNNPLTQDELREFIQAWLFNTKRTSEEVRTSKIVLLRPKTFVSDPANLDNEATPTKSRQDRIKGMKIRQQKKEEAEAKIFFPIQRIKPNS
jgi:hypothetical protein